MNARRVPSYDDTDVSLNLGMEVKVAPNNLRRGAAGIKFSFFVPVTKSNSIIHLLYGTSIDQFEIVTPESFGKVFHGTRFSVLISRAGREKLARRDRRVDWPGFHRVYSAAREFFSHAPRDDDRRAWFIYDRPSTTDEDNDVPRVEAATLQPRTVRFSGKPVSTYRTQKCAQKRTHHDRRNHDRRFSAPDDLPEIRIVNRALFPARNARRFFVGLHFEAAPSPLRRSPRRPRTKDYIFIFKFMSTFVFLLFIKYRILMQCDNFLPRYFYLSRAASPWITVEISAKKLR